jgi:hypothetical protein
MLLEAFHQQYRRKMAERGAFVLLLMGYGLWQLGTLLAGLK